MEKIEKQFKDCDICYSNATCLCFKCNNYFCERCFKLIHPQNPMNLFCVNENGNYIYY